MVVVEVVSERLNNSRISSAFDNAAAVAAEANFCNPGTKCKRVLALLNKLKVLEAIYRDASASGRKKSLFITQSGYGSAVALQGEINEILAKYQVRFVASGARRQEPGIQIQARFSTRSQPSKEHHMSEGDAIGMIVHMANEGTLDLFKRCAWRECQRWFVASRRDKRFCNESCKRRHQGSSAEFKEERRKYMRKRY